MDFYDSIADGLKRLEAQRDQYKARCERLEVALVAVKVVAEKCTCKPPDDPYAEHTNCVYCIATNALAEVKE